MSNDDQRLNLRPQWEAVMKANNADVSKVAKGLGYQVGPKAMFSMIDSVNPRLHTIKLIASAVGVSYLDVLAASEGVITNKELVKRRF